MIEIKLAEKRKEEEAKISGKIPKTTKCRGKQIFNCANKVQRLLLNYQYRSIARGYEHRIEGNL